MSGHKDNVMEDKYAKKAVSFKADTAPLPKEEDHSKYQTMEGMHSVVSKQKEQEEASKPKGLVRRKLDRIFGALGDVRTMFF